MNNKTRTSFSGLALVFLTAVCLTGCSSASTQSTETETDEETSSAVTETSSADSEAAADHDGTYYKYNYTVTEVTEEELIDQVGFDLPAPENASDVSYQIVDTGIYDDDQPLYIAEMIFTIDGQKMYLCAQDAQETAIGEYETVGEDIADLDNTIGWGSTTVEGEEPTVQSFKAEIYVVPDTEEDIPYKDMGYIAWIDSDTMILYNLCVTENSTELSVPEMLLNYANEVFVPDQNKTVEETEDSLEDYLSNMNPEGFCTAYTDASSDFLGLLRAIDAIEHFEYKTKEERASKAAEALILYIDTYADSLNSSSLSSISELAAEQMNNLKDEMVMSIYTVDDFKRDEQAALDEFNTAVLEEHPSFEADVLYQQIYNSIQDAISNLS